MISKQFYCLALFINVLNWNIYYKFWNEKEILYFIKNEFYW